MEEACLDLCSHLPGQGTGKLRQWHPPAISCNPKRPSGQTRFAHQQDHGTGLNHGQFVRLAEQLFGFVGFIETW